MKPGNDLPVVRPALSYLFALLFFCLSSIGFATEAPPPASLTVFANYGSPVAPPLLANAISDGLGFEVLGEWNPSTYASVGLSFEDTTFYYSGYNANVQFLNLEGRVFPFERGKAAFAPYVMGGAGLSLNAGGSLLLKAGIGSRVNLVGPFALDLMAGSHWVQNPGSFQYVDARAGLSYSFDFKDKAKPTPKTTATPSPSVTPKASVSPTPTSTEVSVELPQASPTPATFLMEEPTPITGLTKKQALSLMKATYHKGTAALKAHKYKTAIPYFKKAIAIKEKHVPAYYYAEAYADLGIIYQFRMTTKGHKQAALEYYRRALKIDPQTQTAKKYYKKLKKELGVAAKPKPAEATQSTSAPEQTQPAETPQPKVQAVPTASSSEMSIDMGK